MHWNFRPLATLTVLTSLILMCGCISVGASARSTGANKASSLHRHQVLAWPNSIGAAGDSITQAFDVDPHGALRDNPADSWSTGTNSSTDSLYRRILAKHGEIRGHRFNVSVPGSVMSDLDGQLRQLAAKKVAFVTILMGHNDLCTPTISSMTPVKTFRQEYKHALTRFLLAERSAHVYVLSLLSLLRLWKIMHGNPRAEQLWGPVARVFTGKGVCQSMLNPKNTSADRAFVNAREVAYNTVLGRICQQHTRCHWDGDAAFGFQFSAGFISKVDYFHPSVAGQQALAELAWRHGYW